MHDRAAARRERADQLDLAQARAGQHAAVGEQLDAAQPPQVEDHAAGDGRGADVAVPAGADAHGDLARARDPERRREVARVERLGDGGGVHAVVAPVVDGRARAYAALPGSSTGPRIARCSAASGAGARRRSGSGGDAPAPASSCARVRPAMRGFWQPYPAAMSEVAALEDVCERAWPPRERLELDGAVLRFTHGFTRRANSARVDGGGGDLEGLIERAEREYRSRGLRPGFRLTPLTPAAFEPLLLERGYFVDTEAVVMVAEALPATAAAARRRHRARARARRGVAARVPGDRAQVAGRAGPGRALGARLGRLAAPLRARARRRRARRDRLWPAGGRLALHRVRRDVPRAPPARSRARVSDRLFAWGAAAGARRAILQAETKNAAAQALYATLGFTPRYVYRDFVPPRERD